MSLESILQHIGADVKAQKENIIQSAQDDAAQILERSRADAQKAYEEIMIRQKSLEENQKQKCIVAARLEAKKDLLAVKQEFINAVFEKLKSQLAKEQVYKTSIFLDREVATPEDAEFYITKIRSEHESEIARILF
jgi:vacuolar-type H+-ATPase subunit E/Vma4